MRAQGHWLEGDRAHRAGRDRAQPARRRTCRSDHFLSMCDDTGLFQHAVHSVPDRSHGYCVDDNARALLLACALNEPASSALVGGVDGPLCRLRPACVESRHRTVSQFHGLRSDAGSKTAAPRTVMAGRLWALGECARSDASPSRRRWAAALFAEALPTVEDLSFAPRVGFHAAGSGRLLRRRSR